ncbi:MAG: chorismate synthase [Anaerolineae bacterium]|nr:chorismate synthase [Anaerolineae bacterium]
MNPLRFLTAGESHGPKLTAILEGMVAGLPLTAEAINTELGRRQTAYGSGGRMKIERDTVRITAGVMAGHTTGGPIALEVTNRDYKSWADKEVPPMTIPRPGHADLTAAIKYGYRDLRLGLERASARETTMRVAVGAICKAYLARFGILVGGYVISIGDADAHIPDQMPYPERFAVAEANDVRCPDPDAAQAMHKTIWEAMQAKDTLGGVFEIVALGVPPGLGSHVHFDRKLDARLAAALVSIPAIKGVEIGPAFDNARRRGTQVHDEIVLAEPPKPLAEAGDVPLPDDPAVGNRGSSAIGRASNRAGGLEGGITTGEPIVLRAAMKPISTTLNPLMSVDLATGEPAPTRYERSDLCAVPRAVVIGEAMVAWVLADELVRKLGGDSLAEQLPRFAALRRSRLEDLAMDNAPWRFGYETDGESANQ